LGSGLGLEQDGRERRTHFLVCLVMPFSDLPRPLPPAPLVLVLGLALSAGTAWYLHDGAWLLVGAMASVLLYWLLRLESRLRVELASRVTARTAELAAANAALRASEQRLELALSGAELGLWDWNVATGTLAWNAHWLALRGCAGLNPLPSVATWKGLIHPEDREAMQATLDAHLHGGTAAYVAEYRVGTGVGPWRWVLDTGRVVERDPQGRALRMAGTNLDISERKHAEEDRAARVAAERASCAKSEFLARTSHELRTPLNAILGFAQMMQLDVQVPLPPVQAQRLRQIQGAGEHLLTMINEMLDLNGIEAGTMRLSLEPVPLAPLAAQCLQGLEPLARAADVSLRVYLAPGIAAVQADATRLREVLINLLSNAVKYNRRGGWVRLSARPAGAARVAVDVEDTGRGLSDAQLAQLFQPFNRLGAERMGIQGTGLGLVIARRLAQLMHGSLQAARREGGGSVFTLELPVALPEPTPRPAADDPGADAAQAGAGGAAATPALDRPALPEGARPDVTDDVTDDVTVHASDGLPAAPAVQPQPQPQPQPAPAPTAQPPAASATPLVLYIEDEPVNALLVQHIMGLRPGCELRVAQDGTSGLAAARSERPALVLIDLNLPDMSGHEVLAQLRADPATRALRCVALTADAMPANVERARAAGFDDFWSKPIEVQSFLRGLDRQLALARGEAVDAGSK
jgi:PAS domain S-box-containing protein